MKLAEARARKLYTVQELAKAVGGSASNLYKIEEGAWLPSLKLVRKLAIILEVKPEEVEEFRKAIAKARNE